MDAPGHPAPIGWSDSLRSSDAGQVWRHLHRLVRSHPLVHAGSATAATCSPADTHDDLTQELFVRLLGKDRFRHYLDAGMSDREIEAEIGQIELTNLLTSGLRRRYPESYRLARRIAVLLRTSRRFRRFGAAALKGRRVGLTEQVYGLSRWPEGMPTRPSVELERRVSSIPVRGRDLRMKGRTGDTQLIIGNAELEALMVEVFEAIDAPADVRTVRGLVMSRLPLLDVTIAQFRAVGKDEDGWGTILQPADSRPTPEQEVLRRDSEVRAGERVDEFLRRLSEEVNRKATQYERILSVLWHCYLSDEHPTQLAVAARLRVSDSLVSDYRRRIEKALRSLSLDSIEEGRRFEEALLARIKAREGISPVPFRIGVADRRSSGEGRHAAPVF